MAKKAQLPKEAAKKAKNTAAAEKKQLIQTNLHQILKDIKADILPKYGLGHLSVAEIAFNELNECPPGYELDCKNYGIDPRTGEPIVRCKCVKKY